MAGLTPALSQAADGSWNVNAAGNWNTGSNWLNGIPGSTTANNSDVATFSFPLTAARTVTVDTGRYIGGITFGNNSTFGYTLSGGSLNLNNGGVIQNLPNNGAHTDSVNSAIQIVGDGGSAFFTANASSSLLNIGGVTGNSTAGNTTTLTLNGSNTAGNAVGVIGNGTSGGNLALVKDGTGTWGIGVSTPSTYTGGTFIKSGRLNIGSNNILPSDTVLTFGSSNAAGTFGLGGGLTGRTQTVGGLLTTGQGGSVVGVSSTSLGTLTVNLTSGNNLFEGRLGGSTAAQTGLNFVKNGAGTLTLSPTNTTNNYIGSTTLSGGTLVFGRVAAKSTSTTVTAAAGTVVGLGVGGTGYYSETDVSNLFANTLSGFTLDATTGVGIDTTAGNFTYSVNQGGVRSLTKLGANTLTLSGTNTYTGNTTVSAGALQLATNGSLRFVIGGSGTNNSVNGTGTTTMNGQFNFDLTGASTNTNATWTIVANTLTNSYGTNFLVNGFTGAGGSWTNTTNGVRYVFSQSSGTLSVQATNNLTPVDPFQAWVASWQAINPGFIQTAGTDDPDGDGYNNNMEFAFDGNPTVGSPALISVASSADGPVFSFLARRDAGAVSYVVESTSDLSTVPWTDNNVVTASIKESSNQANVPLVGSYVRLEFTVTSAGGKSFYRVRATIAP
ncbi:MAG: autotransporter-associated beta strand repeat-containing protein [Candidatus Pacebacteria bacterium]|nr:autotransporter-associated beta strand repeat-containing protein [Candidatus Paceibacterota bacterium]